MNASPLHMKPPLSKIDLLDINKFIKSARGAREGFNSLVVEAIPIKW